MKIIDTYNILLSTFLNQQFSIHLWREYANLISPFLSDKVEKDADSYDFNNQVLPIIDNTLINITKIEESHNSFLEATQQLESRFFAIFQSDLDVDIIFYLGLCNGAGWATTLNGRKTVLLGIEKIIELDWCDLTSMSALIYHEVGHIWHNTVGILNQNTNNQSEQAICQLYQEGIAMYCEQLLCNDFSFYHQNKYGWLKWCEQHRIELLNEYIRRIDKCESTKDFFGDWGSYQGYSDLGYFLGCEFIKRLLDKYSLIEIAKLSLKTITSELRCL